MFATHPAENYFIGAGVKYFWLGDADAVTGAHTEAGKFEDNYAVGIWIKYWLPLLNQCTVNIA